MNSPLVDELPTPSVVVDYEALLANVRWAQNVAEQHGLALRPHIKTHKSSRIAQMQIDAGAVGITTSKPAETLRFVNAGFKSITLAYPLVSQEKLLPLFAAARDRGVELRLIADSPIGIEAIISAATQTAYSPGVFLKIDVGLHRVGVSAYSDHLLQFARKITAETSVCFSGLLSHAGHAYGASSAGEVRVIAGQEAQLLRHARERLQSDGIEVRELSVGSTPTVLASDDYDGITEIRPGNYVFMDRTPLRLGLVSIDRIALSVVATVVSANDKYLIVDAGSKVLSSDAGAHGTGQLDGFGLAFPKNDYPTGGEPLIVEKLSEEHGFVRRDARDLAIGSKVRIIPNHSCAVVNLADELTVIRNNETLETWEVSARGAAQ
ncbi:MAG: alanine racemase [Chthoniobacterales bacterium]|nr:alanine racemase [Chthoniobacterales bacterium]